MSIQDTAPRTSPLSYTISGFCEATGLSRATVYRLFQAGTITPRKAGNRTLILGEDVRAYLHSLPVANIGSAEPLTR